MKHIIWQKPDGEILETIPAVVDPISGLRYEEPESDYLDRLAARIKQSAPAVLDAARVADLQKTDIPNDFGFRGALRWNGSRLFIDMAVARSIHMDRIRAARDAKLEALDREWMAAVGQNQKALAEKIEVERQRLRMLPENFDLSHARTPKTLASLWPKDLPRDGGQTANG